MDILMTVSDGLPRVNEDGEPESEQDWEGIRRIATGESESGLILVRSSMSREQAARMILDHDNPNHPLHDRHTASLASANSAHSASLAMGATNHEAWCEWRNAYNATWRARETSFPAPRPNFPMPTEEGDQRRVVMVV